MDRSGGLPTPEQSESFPVPPQHGLGLDQKQGVAPLCKESREHHHQASLVEAKARAFDGPRCDDELLSKERVLGDHLGTRPGQIRDEPAPDARGPERVAERPRRPGYQAADHRRKMRRDVEHRAIRADPNAIIKACSDENPERSCGGRGKVAKTPMLSATRRNGGKLSISPPQPLPGRRRRVRCGFRPS